MKTIKKNISREDFRRYLENQMTDAERNAFERELQKNPFEAEALEGFQQISSADLEHDLNELSGKITSYKKKINTRFWAAAATLLLLVSVGIIWFQLKDKNPVPELTEVKTIQKEEEVTQPTEPQIQAVEELSQREETQVPSKPEITEFKKEAERQAVPIIEELEDTPSQITAENEINLEQLAEITEESEIITTETKIAATADNQIQIRGLSTTQKSAVPAFNSEIQGGAGTGVIHGKIISLADSQPLTGATIIEKGTTNGTISDLEGNFTLQLSKKSKNILVASFIGMENTEFSVTGESFKIVGLEPEQLALDEVVVIGYGTQKKTAEPETIKNAQPKNGIASFNKFMDENAVLPEEYPENRVIIRVLLKINEQGKIISFENLNNTDSELFEKTKQILLGGPEWNPGTINGNPVESEVNLRIVFRKNR